MKIKIINNKQEFNYIIKEQTNKKYVQFGDDNQYPQHLLDLKNSNGLHNSIINKKVMMGVGEGLFLEKGILPMANDIETLDDVFEKCYNDLEIFGGFYVQPIYNRTNMSPKIYHIPFEMMRSGKKNNKGLIDNYYYSENWKPYMQSRNIDELKAYKKGLSSSIYYAKKYTAGQLYYSLPYYNSAVLDIKTLAEISNYHNSNLKNNFQPGALFILKPGSGVEDEDLNQQIREIEEQIGTDGTGSIIIYVQDERGETPELIQFETNDIDKQFDILSTSVKDNIVISHGIPRQVIGLKEAGSLGGGAKELAEANVYFYNEYVKKNQNFILNHFNNILGLELNVKNTISNPYLYDTDLLENNLSVDEIRELMGYEKSKNNINNNDK